MRQVKKLTRAQRQFLQKYAKYGKNADLSEFRFVKETKDTFEYINDKGELIVFNKEGRKVY